MLQNENERTLINALVEYASRNPDAVITCRLIVANNGRLGDFEEAFKNQKAIDDLTGSIPADTIRIPKKRDRTLIKRALAALLLRSDADEARRQQVESLATDIGIDLEELDAEQEEMKVPEIPERNLEWRSGDGRSVKIKDMDDSHLMNAIRFMERSAKSDQVGEIFIMHALLAFRPSRAIKAMMDNAKAEKPEAPTMYWIMRREALRRGMILPPAATKDEPAKEKINTPRIAKPGARAFTLD